MGLIKDIYSPSFIDQFGNYLEQVVPSFDKKKFTSLVFDRDFKDKEWKGRMKHITSVLHEFLPKDFPKAVKLISKLIKALQKNNFGEDSLAFVIFPDYIGTYGLEDFTTSVEAFEFVTQFVSCEFAVRPFVLRYGQRMIDEMIRWSKHPGYKVRRLASEGSRPRLPWAMAIPALKKDPAAILPLLENLKNDPHEWVRRSVANNLNDIAKDHPEIVLRLAVKWKGISKETDSIIKHGSRTLLKKGDSRILEHYGLDSNGISIGLFKILTPSLKIGQHLEFSFRISNDTTSERTVRLEYGIYYQMANGQLTKKVFKISERVFTAGEVSQVHRRQSFKLITTRKFYVGEHKVSVILNGEEKLIKSFKITP
jgi:3-methyladenine DNA glycosylase AlkC